MKRLGWILALCIGGGAILYAHDHPSSSDPQIQTQQAAPSDGLSNDNYYTNSDGNRVHSPARDSDGVPAGATAVCEDGTYSFSQHHQGTCSHHGGVARWL